MDQAFQEVLRELEVKRSEISCSRVGAYNRGHSSGRYKLVPSLLRDLGDARCYDDALRDEHNFFHACVARSQHLLTPGASS